MNDILIRFLDLRRRRTALGLRLPLLATATRAPDPAGVVQDKLDLLAAQAALAALSPRQLACMVLRYYQGLPVAEIADLLRCSAGTVNRHFERRLDPDARSLGTVLRTSRGAAIMTDQEQLHDRMSDVAELAGPAASTSSSSVDASIGAGPSGGPSPRWASSPWLPGWLSRHSSAGGKQPFRRLCPPRSVTRVAPAWPARSSRGPPTAR